MVGSSSHLMLARARRSSPLGGSSQLRRAGRSSSQQRWEARHSCWPNLAAAPSGCTFRQRPLSLPCSLLLVSMLSQLPSLQPMLQGRSTQQLDATAGKCPVHACRDICWKAGSALTHASVLRQQRPAEVGAKGQCACAQTSAAACNP